MPRNKHIWLKYKKTKPRGGARTLRMRLPRHSQTGQELERWPFVGDRSCPELPERLWPWGRVAVRGAEARRAWTTPLSSAHVQPESKSRGLKLQIHPKSVPSHHPTLARHDLACTTAAHCSLPFLPQHRSLFPAHWPVGSYQTQVRSHPSSSAHSPPLVPVLLRVKAKVLTVAQRPHRICPSSPASLPSVILLLPLGSSPNASEAPVSGPLHLLGPCLRHSPHRRPRGSHPPCTRAVPECPLCRKAFPDYLSLSLSVHLCCFILVRGNAHQLLSEIVLYLFTENCLWASLQM